MNTYENACAEIGDQEQSAVKVFTDQLDKIKNEVDNLKNGLVPNCENMPSDDEQKIKSLTSEAESLQYSMSRVKKHFEEKRKVLGCGNFQKTSRMASPGKSGVAGRKGPNGRNWSDRTDCHSA